ncbi:Extensin family protein [Rhizobium sp. CF080]|uniref:extensin-like domain-containing protein n=1 Tax=Rhizobium sp. (strain CF080) TaxID=1144310 RepID=UPI0003E7F350|nr:extensin family protein [Rhizobium sp. CF080]EUB95770.1 Extensin family protein [Rhizobium sp. CF080]
MAYASFSRRVIGSLMIPTMLAACSAGDLVPPAPIDDRRVGAIQPMRDIPREPVSQQAYQMSPAPVSQASAVDYVNTPNLAGNGYPNTNYQNSAYPNSGANDGGHYLRAPAQVQTVPLNAPMSQQAPAARQGRLPMIDSDEAMQQQASAGRRNTTRNAGPMTIPEDGVNIDAELGFGPDESDVTGLAEEEDSDIAEGVGDQPVVDGIGTDNPRALQPRRQPISQSMPQSMNDDRVLVPPKRQGAGLQGDLSNGNMANRDMGWGNERSIAPPGSRSAAGTQQVAMLRPNNPMIDNGPMSQRDMPWQREVMPQSEVSCRAELRRLGVEFDDRPSIDAGPSCRVPYPVKLSGLSGNIDVKPAVTLNCQTTLAFAKWVKNELAPSARYRYLTGIQKIVPMGGYSCRRMNNSNQRNNPMSEHAKGNAIDIGQIVLKDGHEIDVRKKGLFSMREGGLLKAVRSDSCKYFNTVLGPGSNAEHWNHFHFDLRSRRGGKRYCD